MNTLRTFIVFAILAAVGYGVYATLTHQPPPPPPEVTGQVWGDAPNVELPGAPTGMPPVGGPPGTDAGGTAPAFGTPLSAAPDGAPVSLEAGPHQQAPGEVGSVAAAGGYQPLPGAGNAPYSDSGPPADGQAPPLGADGAPAQPGYPPPYPGPAGANVPLAPEGAPPYATDPGAPTAGGPPYNPAYDNVAAPDYPAPQSPGGPPPTGEGNPPPQDAAIASAAPAAGYQDPAAAQQDPAASGASFDAVVSQVQSQLDQGRLAEAHLELSRWYGAPQLTQAQRDQVHDLLDRLAGTVVYSQESLLEPPYEVQPGDNLERISKHYEIPWQLLAKINGIGDPEHLRPGESLKVIRGPFNATVDLTGFKLTLWLGERYAGSFPIGVGRDQSTPPGTFQVVNKQENPAYYGREAVVQADDPNNPLGERWIDLGNHIGIHGTSEASSIGQAESRGCIRLSERDVEDVYDILGVGSSVVIRR